MCVSVCLSYSFQPMSFGYSRGGRVGEFLSVCSYRHNQKYIVFAPEWPSVYSSTHKLHETSFIPMPTYNHPWSCSQQTLSRGKRCLKAVARTFQSLKSTALVKHLPDTQCLEEAGFCSVPTCPSRRRLSWKHLPLSSPLCHSPPVGLTVTYAQTTRTGIRSIGCSENP